MFLFHASCKKSPVSPEIKLQANLKISMQYEPVVFIYNSWYESWCCSNCIILSETNGVGGHIFSAKLSFIYKNNEYESKTYEGKSFKAFESWKVCDTFCTIYEYEKVKIYIEGKDNNGYSIYKTKYFNISYSNSP